MNGLNGAFVVLVGLGVCFALGIIAEQGEKKDPTIQQWVNRLIEFVEGEDIPEAYKRFSHLVASGLEPQHAFEIAIRS